MSWSDPTEVFGTEAVVTMLENGEPYKFQVRAKRGALTSEWSEEESCSPQQGLTEVPEPLRDFGAFAADRHVTLYWSDPNGGGQVEIAWRRRGAAGWTVLADLINTYAPYDVVNLVNGTEYEFRARAWNDFGESEWSPVATATPRIGRAPDPVLQTSNEEAAVIVKFANDPRGLCSGDTPITLANGARYKEFAALAFDPYIQVTDPIGTSSLNDNAGTGSLLRIIVPPDVRGAWEARRAPGEIVIAGYLRRKTDGSEFVLLEHGFIGRLDGITETSGGLYEISFMSLLEIVSKQDPEIWSNASHQSRVRNDLWFGDLELYSKSGPNVRLVN